jgi:hypothetical protein
MKIKLNIDREKFKVSLQFLDIKDDDKINLIRGRDLLFRYKKYDIRSVHSIDINNISDVYLIGSGNHEDNQISTRTFNNIKDCIEFYKDIIEIIKKLERYVNRL